MANDASINIWAAPWIPNIDGFIPKPPINATPTTTTWINELIDEETCLWNISVLQLLFDDTTVSAITSVQPAFSRGLDEIIWTKTVNCAFSTEYAYLLIANQGSSAPSFSSAERKQLWRAKIHNCHELLL